MKNNYKLNLSKYSTHQIIIDLIGENKTVLDVGCNEGYIGLHAHNTNVFYGLDYSPDAIEIAKTIYRDSEVMDLNYPEQLKFIPEKYDVIVFADVLEHLIDPKSTLEYFMNYLEENGKIIISLPNIANWQVRLNLLLGRFDYKDNGIMDKTHFHLYTFKSARLLVEDCRLQIIEEKSGASLFGPIVKLFPFLKGLLSTGIILKCQKIN